MTVIAVKTDMIETSDCDCHVAIAVVGVIADRPCTRCSRAECICSRTRWCKTIRNSVCTPVTLLLRIQQQVFSAQSIISASYRVASSALTAEPITDGHSGCRGARRPPWKNPRRILLWRSLPGSNIFPVRPSVRPLIHRYVRVSACACVCDCVFKPNVWTCYSLSGPLDADNISKVMGSKVKVRQAATAREVLLTL